MGTWVAAIVAVLTVTGCKYGADSFACTDNASCGGTGICQANSLCSFPDGACPSGQRYGDIAGASSGQCVGETQMPPDAMPDAPPDARACFGSGLVAVCLTAAPTMPLTIGAGGQTIDTSDNTMCTPTVSGADNYCVVAATTITVNGTLKAKGSKPLVLLASDTITVTQLIDVASRRTEPEFIGAGSDPAAPACTVGTTPGNRAGGPGGSFTGSGGKGGDAAGGGGGNGGNAGAAAAVNALRGGCPGSNGDGTGKGLGGHGGGAVYLIAGTKIEISGPGINAGGEGGGAGVPVGGNSSGAGGGGSGGMIGFDAPTITCTSPLIANGGAGGEGSGTVNNGAPGGDGTTQTAATGGNNGSMIGGDGGNGSAGAANGGGANGKNGSSQAGADGGGGGGGGGAGIVKGPAASLGNMVTPAATP
jgi:hypothetical protein